MTAIRATLATPGSGTDRLVSPIPSNRGQVKDERSREVMERVKERLLSAIFFRNWKDARLALELLDEIGEVAASIRLTAAGCHASSARPTAAGVACAGRGISRLTLLRGTAEVYKTEVYE